MIIKKAKIVSLVTGLSCATFISSTSPPSMEHLNWALEHADACRESHFGDPAGFRFAGAEGVVVVLRHLAGNGEETQVILDERGDAPATLSATILPEALVDQMARLHQADAEASAEIICSRIQVQSIPSINSSRADKALEELGKTTIHPILSAPLPVHGDSYRIWVYHAATHSYFEFLGLSSSEDHIPPLQVWSDRVLSLAHEEGSARPE